MMGLALTGVRNQYTPVLHDLAKGVTSQLARADFHSFHYALCRPTTSSWLRAVGGCAARARGHIMWR